MYFTSHQFHSKLLLSSRLLFVFSFAHYSYSLLKTISFACHEKERLQLLLSCFYLLVFHQRPCQLYHLANALALILDVFIRFTFIKLEEFVKGLVDVSVDFFIENLILFNQVICNLFFRYFFILMALIIVGKFSIFQNLCFLLLPSLLMIINGDAQNLNCFFFSYLYLLLKLLALILLIF